LLHIAFATSVEVLTGASMEMRLASRDISIVMCLVTKSGAMITSYIRQGFSARLHLKSRPRPNPPRHRPIHHGITSTTWPNASRGGLPLRNGNGHSSPASKTRESRFNWSSFYPTNPAFQPLPPAFLRIISSVKLMI
jgi:hypothetical protein